MNRSRDMWVRARTLSGRRDKGRDEFRCTAHPGSAAERRPKLLNRLIHPHRPDVTIETVEVEDAQSFGVDPDIISSANRVKMRVVYDAATRQAAQVPAEELLLKVANDVRIGQSIRTRRGSTCGCRARSASRRRSASAAPTTPKPEALRTGAR